MTQRTRLLSIVARSAICIALTVAALFLAMRPDGRAADKTDPPKDGADAVDNVRDAARRATMVNDLKQLGLAVHNYHDANGAFPKPAIYDKDGKPLLSWRVMLLPYLEQNELYQQFHLDEPWDSDHNKKLLEKMPKVFAPPDSDAFKNHEAAFQALVGKG
ncbi:MAG TPA: DUF1559 domain-containing protein, partial [Gemmataceae bacterium]|nr:DUF1559 domain-containing protein [Gemmataceae bacterium]